MVARLSRTLDGLSYSEATTFGNACPQIASLAEGGLVDEKKLSQRAGASNMLPSLVGQNGNPGLQLPEHGTLDQI